MGENGKTQLESEKYNWALGPEIFPLQQWEAGCAWRGTGLGWFSLERLRPAAGQQGDCVWEPRAQGGRQIAEQSPPVLHYPAARFYNMPQTPGATDLWNICKDHFRASGGRVPHKASDWTASEMRNKAPFP